MGNLRRVATIGSFDGVHTGHRVVLNRVLEIASERGLTPSVFAFAEHPLEVIDPSRTPPKLMTFDQQQVAFERLGLEVFPIRFNEDIRKMTSSEYMQMLHNQYNVDILVTGYDNRFGSDRQSCFEDYCRFASTIGIEVIQTPEIPDVSSTIIRKLIAEGNINEANHKLGYFYALTGIVEHGKELGKTIGFPTANLRPIDSKQLTPADGVYAAFAVTPDGTLHGAMVNIGHRPTIRDGRTYRSIEANIFDFDEDIYGCKITLKFVEFMRKEIKMSSIDELRFQLLADRGFAALILASV